MNTDHQQGDGVAGPGDAIPSQLFHATLPDWKAWAALHVRDEAGRILLLHSATRRGWQHPGGHADQGELPHETAEREALEIIVGEVDWELARQTHHRRIPGEHEWDTIGDRRPGLYGRLLEPGRDRLHPPSADQFSGDTD